MAHRREPVHHRRCFHHQPDQRQSRQDAVFEFCEVQVKTGGIDAEYGGALGGVISAITKSGGNAFHGDIHYYYSGNALSAGPVLRLRQTR